MQKSKIKRKKLKWFNVFTTEHRHYYVCAKSEEDASEFLRFEADLSPKSKRVKLLTFGDFKIVDTKT